jgi:hypothetical protein
MHKDLLRHVASLTCIAGAALATAACGPSVPAALAGDAPSVADASGRASVEPITGPSEPLIVDWKPEQRGDLEEAIADGIAVVTWDDKGLRLLKRCNLKGEYGYLPLLVKKDVIRLETAEEVAANLPLQGVGLAGKIGAEFNRGTTLDIAMAMVGKRRTTWNDVTTDDLQGGNSCAGATHYVRAITVGAFAMITGSKAKASAAAEIFGASAGGKMGADKGVNSSDGKLDDCEKATPDDGKPPGLCRALLRIELEPIAKAKSGEAPAPQKSDETIAEAANEQIVVDKRTCQPGLVWTGGKCSKAGGDTPHVCKATEAEDCKQQCAKGNAQSCSILAALAQQGKATAEPTSIDAALETACTKELEADACVNLGKRRVFGTGGAAKNPATGMSLVEKGCLLGSAQGCSFVGNSLQKGSFGAPKDEKRALIFFAKGCDGGDMLACTQAGYLLAGASKEVPKDAVKSLEFSRKACFGGNATACGNAGLAYEFGAGVPKNVVMASSLFQRACGMNPETCVRIGILNQHGVGFPKNDQMAQSYFQRSCAFGTGGFGSMACFVNERVYGATGGKKANPAVLMQTVQSMKPQCEQGVARACAFQGVAELAMGQKVPGQMGLQKACGMQDPWACDLQKRLK